MNCVSMVFLDFGVTRKARSSGILEERLEWILVCMSNVVEFILYLVLSSGTGYG